MHPPNRPLQALLAMWGLVLGMLAIQAVLDLRDLPPGHSPLGPPLRAAVLYGLFLVASFAVYLWVRRQTAQALLDADTRLNAILRASADGLLLLDVEGRIQVLNPAAEMFFGRLAEDVQGHPLGDFLVGKDLGWSLSDLLHAAGEGGATRTAEIKARLRDGDLAPVRLSLTPVAQDGRPLFVALLQDLSEVYRNQRRLDHLAHYDSLTGLLNRREFQRRLEAVLSHGEGEERPGVLCHLDVDQFKLINDTAGQAAGDALLKQLAMLLRAHVGDGEILARLGGDEFALLLSGYDLERAEDSCHGLLQTIRSFPFTWKDQAFEITASAGLVPFLTHGAAASQVLSEADVACHMAKRMGRNRLHVYQTSDADLIRHHGDMHLVGEIHAALNEGRFHLYAQPIASVRRPDDPHHYEILVRMVDPGGRLVNPDDFVPAAERYILMPAIDRWVVGRLLQLQAAHLRAWGEAHGATDGFLFAVNLSGTSLTDEALLQFVLRQIDAHRIPAQALCFEITETAVVANLERARELMEWLRTRGCRFALDDFGVGLSSYAYLKELPASYLKIDGAFVRHMAEDPVDHAIVESINQIAHVLGLKTIAEWVESRTTLLQLRALAVDYAQGYVIGEPIPLEQLRPEGLRVEAG